jgi:hypothetical protein
LFWIKKKIVWFDQDKFIFFSDCFSSLPFSNDDDVLYYCDCDFFLFVTHAKTYFLSIAIAFLAFLDMEDEAMAKKTISFTVDPIEDMSYRELLEGFVKLGLDKNAACDNALVPKEVCLICELLMPETEWAQHMALCAQRQENDRRLQLVSRSDKCTVNLHRKTRTYVRII